MNDSNFTATLVKLRKTARDSAENASTPDDLAKQAGEHTRQTSAWAAGGHPSAE